MFPKYLPFQSEWITFAVFLAAILVLLGTVQLASSKLKWSTSTSRKLIHLFVGGFVLSTPFLFQSNFPPATLAIVFVVVNFALLKTKKLPAMRSTNRKTYGTVYFPIAFLLLVLFWWNRPITLEISLLLLTLADTGAAFAGERARNPETFVAWKDEKTVRGSIAMFVSSVFLVGFGTAYFYNLAKLTVPDLAVLIPLSLVVAAIATLAEALSCTGSDNVSVPMVTAVSYDLFLTAAQKGAILPLLTWIVFSFLIAYAVFRLKTLTTDGALGAFLMGILIFGMGSWKFMVPLVLFFAFSSLLSYAGGKKKQAEQISAGKGGNRDIVQVYANGGIPLLIAIWWFYDPTDWLYAAYLASVAAATADTWGTEIGFFSKRLPRNIVTLVRVRRGTSGGVTLLGTIGSLVGSAIIGISGFMFLPESSKIGVIILAGFFAAILDSILGATIQGIFLCASCEKTTEKPIHCDEPATLTHGFQWITNDAVNIICTISGAAIMLLAG